MPEKSTTATGYATDLLEYAAFFDIEDDDLDEPEDDGDGTNATYTVDGVLITLIVVAVTVLVIVIAYKRTNWFWRNKRSIRQHKCVQNNEYTKQAMSQNDTFSYEDGKTSLDSSNHFTPCNTNEITSLLETHEQQNSCSVDNNKISNIQHSQKERQRSSVRSFQDIIAVNVGDSYIEFQVGNDIGNADAVSFKPVATSSNVRPLPPCRPLPSPPPQCKEPNSTSPKSCWNIDNKILDSRSGAMFLNPELTQTLPNIILSNQVFSNSQCVYEFADESSSNDASTRTSIVLQLGIPPQNSKVVDVRPVYDYAYISGIKAVDPLYECTSTIYEAVDIKSEEALTNTQLKVPTFYSVE